MKISYIINTAASDPWVHDRRNMHRSAGYASRHDLLTQRVLPAAVKQGFDEIIVAGCFEKGDGYQYVPVPPRYRDRRDALVQREMGAKYATGDILVFGHDDHALATDFHHTLKWRLEDAASWDLLIPRRIHGVTGTTLNNGLEQPPRVSYMGGHVLVMKRWLWARVPWTSIDSEWWDASLTRIWKEAGGKLVWADDLVHVDVEAAANEI